MVSDGCGFSWIILVVVSGFLAILHAFCMSFSVYLKRGREQRPALGLESQRGLSPVDAVSCHRLSSSKYK